MDFLARLKSLRRLIIGNTGWTDDDIRTARLAEFEYSFDDSFFAAKRVLEIGGSNGYIASIISSQNPAELLSIDINPLYPQFYPVKLSTALDSMSQLELHDKSVDIIFSSNAFEHIANLPHLFAECRRLLTDDGKIVVMLPTHTWRFFFNDQFTDQASTATAPFCALIQCRK